MKRKQQAAVVVAMAAATFAGWTFAAAEAPLVLTHLGSPRTVDRTTVYDCGGRKIRLVVRERTAKDISVRAYGSLRASHADLAAWNASLNGMTEVWRIGMTCDGAREKVVIEGYGLGPDHRARRLASVTYWGGGRLGRAEANEGWDKPF